MIETPIKCHGKKTRLVDWINSYIAEGKETFHDIFMGSGAVLFNVKAQNLYGYDINKHIIAFYEFVWSGWMQSAAAIATLHLHGDNLSKQGEPYYYEIREKFNKNGFEDHRERNIAFLFLSQTCFNGVMRFNSKGEFNVPFCKNPDRLNAKRIDKLLDNINEISDRTITKNLFLQEMDFRSSLDYLTYHTHKESTLLYLDPPYLGRESGYFNTKWTEEDEKDLSDMVRKTGIDFILSTWYSDANGVNPAIEKYWGDCVAITEDHYYSVGPKAKNRYKIKEALISNKVLV